MDAHCLPPSARELGGVLAAAAMLLASHALAAGPLAASQPGFTILDPLSASLLGVFLFGELIQAGPGTWQARRWPWRSSPPAPLP